MTQAGEEKRLFGLTGQERLNAIIELLYTNGSQSLNRFDWESTLPESLIDALIQAAMGNDVLEWRPGGEENGARSAVGTWNCMHRFCVVTCDPDDLDFEQMDSEQVREHLAADDDRISALVNGAEPTAAELGEFMHGIASHRLDESEVHPLFEVWAQDIKGRRITFIYMVGDGGEIVHSDGPFTDHECPLMSCQHQRCVIFEGPVYRARVGAEQDTLESYNSRVWIGAIHERGLPPEQWPDH